MYLRKIGNKWYFSIMVDMADGTRKRIERVGGRTKTEAREAALALVRKEDKFGRLLEPKKIKFDEYLDIWFQNQVQGVLAKNTVDSYRHIVAQLKEAFGSYLLCNISTPILQNYFNSLQNEYAFSTITQLRGVLTKIFNDAIHIYEYIDKNPVRSAKIRRSLNTNINERTASFFSKADIHLIIERWKNNPVFYLPIMLAYHMGMRMGECLALRWDDIDFEGRMIHVCRNQYDKDGVVDVKKRTKNRKDRYIEMDQAICEILEAWKERQKSCQKEYGVFYTKSGYVCTHLDGTKTTSNNLRYFNTWCAENHLPGTFHSLRHTHATQLLDAGMDLDYVSKRLGHSSILLTSKTYVHVSTNRRQKGISVMDKELLTTGSPTPSRSSANPKKLRKK